MQKMNAVYVAALSALGLDPDETPPSGEVGHACERLCRLLGVNPYEESKGPADDRQPAEPTEPAPPTRGRKATAAATGGQDAQLASPGS